MRVTFRHRIGSGGAILWRMRRTMLVCGTVVLAWGAIGGAGGRARPSIEQAVAPAPDTIAIDFYAVTGDGQPVADLAADEVQVKLDGRPRPVKWLEWIPVADAPGSGTGAVELVAAPFGSNAPRDAGRSFIIAVEDDSFRPGRERPLRMAVDRFLAALSPRDSVALVTMPYGGFRANLTKDRDRIRAELAKVTGQGAANESGSEMACRTRRTLESLVGLMSGLRASEGATTVLFVSSGMAGPRRDSAITLAPGMCELTVDMFAQLGAAAGAARATFYVIQPEDVMVRPGGRQAENIAGSGFSGSDNPLEGLEHLAGVTGAERLHLAAGEETLRRVARETSAYYVLGTEVQGNERNGVSRQLDVRVSRPGVTIRARPNLVIPRPDARGVPGARAATPRSMLREARTFRDLPLRAIGYVSSHDDGGLKVVCLMEPAEPSVLFAAAAAGLFDDSGRLVGQWTAEPANLATTPVTGALVAPRPGTYRLRVAATDAAGRSGSADYEIVAALAPAGPLAISSLVLGLSRAGTFTPRLLFGAEPVALGYVDIYGRAESGLSVTAEVARSADGAAIGPSVPGATKAIAGQDRFIATVAVPIGGLPPGDYVVRVIVTARGEPAGRVSRTLRKLRP